ncbi:GLUTRBP [Symbiodinium necroappetens]|uniref:GLUTRBP protein n=1 Tax=Symbiodinium necroappetens TaxID=1628268 RepID=A0A812XUA4_9DINO|nr:GLUTRBP [Symbiodinium necroappetens]
MASTFGSARRMAVLSGHVLLQPASNILDPVEVADASAELQLVRRQGHSVPDAMKQEGSSAVMFFENHARRLSHAEKVRTMLHTISNGTLSTSHHETGWPYGSIVNFATEPRPVSDGGPRIVTFVSRLAEHTANLQKNSRACILVSEVQGKGDRLAVARAALMVEALQVPKTETAKDAFLSVHPNASYVHFDDFLCFELSVKSIRYIGGFGEMSWVSGQDFASAEYDPVAADVHSAKSAVDHCNDDHADAVLDMAKAFAGLPLAGKATMLSVDRYGFDVLCQMPDGLRRSRVEFAKRLDSAADLREAMMSTTQSAREKLPKNV